MLLSMEGQKALRFHQKYFNLCSDNEHIFHLTIVCLTGLERHEGEQLMTEFSFLGELSL